MVRQSFGERQRNQRRPARPRRTRESRRSPAPAGTPRSPAPTRTGRCRLSAGCGSSRRCSRRRQCLSRGPRKIAPACTIWSSTAAGSATASCRCSGAYSLTNAIAVSQESVSISVTSPSARCSATAAITSGSGLTNTDWAPATVLGLCHQIPRQVLRRSGAIGKDDQLAGTGQRLDSDFAEEPPFGLLHVGVTGTNDEVHGRDRLGTKRHRCHGLSTTCGVDLRRLPEAHRRPGRRSAPGRRRPAESRHAIWGTPATCAGTIAITALDGYAAPPPGTYRPARCTGTWRVETICPCGSSTRVAGGNSSVATVRRFAARSSIASRTDGSISSRARASSSALTRLCARSAPSSRDVRRRSASSPPRRTMSMMSATVRRTSSRASSVGRSPTAAVTTRSRVMLRRFIGRSYPARPAPRRTAPLPVRSRGWIASGSASNAVTGWSVHILRYGRFSTMPQGDAMTPRDAARPRRERL